VQDVGIIAITSQLKIKTRSRSISSSTRSENEILKIADELFLGFFSESANSGLRIRRVGIKVSELSSDAGSQSGTLEDFLTR